MADVVRNAATANVALDARTTEAREVTHDPAPSFVLRHGPVLERIRAAIDDISLWDALRADPAYGDFLLELHGMLVGDGSSAQTGAVLDRVSQVSGLSTSALLQLESANRLVLRQGGWIPKAIASRRMHIESKRLVEQNKSAGGLKGTLARVSDKIVPGIQRWPTISKALIPAYWAADKALPVVDAAGELAVDMLHLRELGDFFDAKGDDLATDLQRRYRAMQQSLAPLELGLTRGRKVKKLQKYSTEEQRMILMTGALLSELTGDLDSMLDLVRDPDKRRDEGMVARLRDATRFTLESLAGLARGSADLIEGLTDEDGWRQFSLMTSVGGRITLFGFSLAGGMGIYIPSIDEYCQSKNPTLKNDLTYPAFAGPVVAAMANSRGGNLSFSLPGVVARQNAYSSAIGVGIPYIGIVVAQQDVVNGPGVEVGLFPQAGALGIFEAGAGAGVAVFHPGLGFLAKPVKKASAVVGEALEASVDWLSIPAKPLEDGVRACFRRVRNRRAKHRGEEPPADTPPTAEAITERRLGASAVRLDEARKTHGLLEAYRRRVDERLTAGLPIGDPDSPMFRKMTAGFGETEGTTIIREFLDRVGARYDEIFAGVDEATSSSGGSPREERRIKATVRSLARKTRELDAIVAFVDLLLADLMPGVRSRA